MATVYDALGSKVTVVELLDQLIPGADKDLIRVLEKRVKGRYEAIHLKTGVESVEAQRGRPDGQVRRAHRGRSTGSSSPSAASPNGKVIGADDGGRQRHDRGFIESDLQMRTNVPAHLLDRRRPRRADAGPQGHARGRRWRPR